MGVVDEVAAMGQPRTSVPSMYAQLGDLPEAEPGKDGEEEDGLPHVALMLGTFLVFGMIPIAVLRRFKQRQEEAKPMRAHRSRGGRSKGGHQLLATEDDDDEERWGGQGDDYDDDDFEEDFGYAEPRKSKKGKNKDKRGGGGRKGSRR